MFCSNCKSQLKEGAKFCGNCGQGVAYAQVDRLKNEPNQEKENVEDRTISDVSESQAVIKCGNCGFVGKGESARRMVFKVLAWSVVLFAPLLTILYFVATHKYRCPKCRSTFLGVKNEHGVFVGQRGGSFHWAMIIVVIIVGVAIVGILASITLASLNSARRKSRDARRITDIKQTQLALELYYDAYSKYPASLNQLAPKYMPEVPRDPINRTSYNYTNCGDGTKYHLGASLEDGENSALSKDDDIGSMCFSDPVSGLDESKCSNMDSGSHCYDVTSGEYFQ